MMKEKINKILIIIGFLTTLFIIWNRFIRVRLPKDLIDFPSNVLLIILYYLIIVGFIINIIYNLRKILNIKKKDTFISKLILKIANNYYIDKIITLFTNIQQSPQTAYEYLFQHFNIAGLVEVPLKLIIHIFFFIFINLPKVFVCSLFVLDIYYYQKLNYFYSSLFLLGIPLLFTSYIYITNNLTDKNLYYLIAHLDFDDQEETLSIQFKKEIPNHIPDAIDIVDRKYDRPLLLWFIYNFDLYTDIKGLINLINAAETSYKPYISIYIYSCYLLGWSYILFYNDLFFINFTQYMILDVKEPFSDTFLQQ